MLKNPIQLRLEKFEPWQQLTFMVALVERMYPNYAVFCQQTHFTEPQQFRQLLDVAWEVLTVKNAKINFERQLEKLEPLIPMLDDYDLYLVYPAVDACIGLSTLLHCLLDKENMLDFALKVSQISVKSVAQLEEAQTGTVVTNENQKSVESVCLEWDVQWEIFRVLKEAEERDVDMIRDIRDELREEGLSNLGLTLD